MTTREDMLAAQVQALTEDLQGIKDMLALWRRNGLDELRAGHGNQYSGSGKVRLDDEGVNVAIGSDDTEETYLSVRRTFASPIGGPEVIVLRSNLAGTAPARGLQLYHIGVDGALYGGIQAKGGAISGAASYLIATEGVAGAGTERRVGIIAGATDSYHYVELMRTRDGQLSADPAAGVLADADRWYNTTSDRFKGRANGVTDFFTMDLDLAAYAIARGVGTTKGDLLVATASAVWARQAVGSNGQVLTADSAQTNGIKWATGASGMMKTSGAGYFTIPSMPAVGTTVATSVANTYGSWVQMIGATSAALYIIGLTITCTNTSAITYTAVDIASGGAGAETSLGYIPLPGFDYGVDAGQAGQTVWLPAPIPVATATRIACRTADSLGAPTTYSVTLHCINQTDLVAL